MYFIDLLPVVLSFAGTLVLTPVVRALARRRGVVARPKSDRWHKKPTALLGGGAIFTVVAAVALALVPITPEARVVLGAGSFLFLVGLIDDFFNLKPYQKLSGQIMGAAVVVWCGLTLPWTGSPPVNMAITLFWLIGITNAVNLLDNMDGLAAGIAAIASAFLALNFRGNGQAAEALILAVFGAALLGFLVYNSNPASIFMGDCGSMFIGFFLAGSALLNPTGGRSRTVLPVLAVPVLILFIPIFDTLLVTILRKLAGRSVARGGRDHTSHRLVALGLSERRAVWMLYALAAVSGFLGLLVRDLALDYSLAAVLGFVLLLTFVGVYLGGVKVYDEAEVRTARAQPLVAFLVDLSYKRRVFEVLLDVMLITLSYYLAYAAVFGHLTGDDDEPLRRFLLVVPVLVSVKLLTFLGMGVYRGLWRYVSIDDLIVFAEAVVAASAVSALALLFAFRFEGFSRVVIILDGLILLVLLTGSRLTFRLFRQLLPAPRTSSGHRVLIYGAGDAGDLLARELLNNASLQCTPVGFADDDPLKKGKIIHGLRVYGGNGSFLTICGQHAIDEVLISSMKFTPERLDEIARECTTLSLPLRRMRIQIEALDDGTGSAARSLLNRLGQPDPYLA